MKEREANIYHQSYISFVSTKDPTSAIADSIGQTTIAVLRNAIQ